MDFEIHIGFYSKLMTVFYCPEVGLYVESTGAEGAGATKGTYPPGAD